MSASSPDLFGSRLLALRTAAGLSHRALADKIGCDFGFLSKLENGKAAMPSAEWIVRLGTALGLSQVESDELVTLAGRVPPDVTQLLVDHPALCQAVRKMAKQPGE